MSLRLKHFVVPSETQGQFYLDLIECVPLATEPGISLIILPLMRILQRNLKRTTDTFLFISHTSNVLLFKFRCNILIGVRIIKEMPGSVASGTHCIFQDKPYARLSVVSQNTNLACHCYSNLLSKILSKQDFTEQM